MENSTLYTPCTLPCPIWAQQEVKKVKLKTSRSCINKNYIWHSPHIPMHIWVATFILYPFSSINIVAVFLELLFQDFRNFYAYCSFFHVPFCVSVLFFFLQQISERKHYIGREKRPSAVDNSLNVNYLTLLLLKASANSFFKLFFFFNLVFS